MQLEEQNQRFCSICESSVNLTSKHCVQCGRCTIGFDHHCKWVNNCIGEKNYLKFIILLVITELFYLFVLCNCGFFLKQVVNTEKVKLLGVWTFGKELIYAEIVIVMIAATFSVIVCIFNGYLIIFHIFIKVKGMTTFQFIMKKNTRVEPEDNSEDLQSSPRCKKETRFYFECHDKLNKLDITVLSKLENIKN